MRVIARSPVPLAPQSKILAPAGRLTSEQLSFAADAGHRVAAILFRKTGATRRLPVVVILHGTGGSKEGQVRLLQMLATRGFLAIAIDARHHGTGTAPSAYDDGILRAYRTGKEHPFLYDTVWDTTRLLDYLSTRPDVDAERIALIGFSKGGMETYLTAAIDPRIAVAIPFIGVQSFRWALEHDQWRPRIATIQSAANAAARDEGLAAPTTAFVRKFYDRVVPGILGDFDGPSLLPLIAPRPLMVVNGDSDDRTPIGGLNLCVDAARAAYRGAGAGDRFSFLLQKNTGHTVTAEAERLAVDWLVRWLRPDKW